MIFQQNSQFKPQWKLKEFVQIGPEMIDGNPVVPLQLQHFATPVNPDMGSSPLWFLSGFQGPSRNDSYMTSLIHKALAKFTFEPVVDVYVTPVVNPTSPSKNPDTNWAGANLNTSFENGVQSPQLPQLPPELKTLVRWMGTITPKAIVTFSLGNSMIRYLNTPSDVIQKLSELSEKASYPMGTEPEAHAEDNVTLLPRQKTDAGFGAFCVTNGIAWIDICVDRSKKSFDEIKESEWRPSFGPALKWLVEGFRFNPVKEEVAVPLPKVIPALEMPPEFANL